MKGELKYKTVCGGFSKYYYALKSVVSAELKYISL